MITDSIMRLSLSQLCALRLLLFLMRSFLGGFLCMYFVHDCREVIKVSYIDRVRIESVAQDA